MPRPTITSAYTPDIGELREWLQQMIASMKLVELVAAVVALVTRMRDVNAELVKQLASLRRKRPRSETLERLERQLAFAFGTSPAKPAAAKTDETKRRRHRHGRTRPAAHLPRVVVDNPVPAALRICPRCGSQMTTVGHSVCEFLEVIPARVVVVQRRDERVACPHDDAIVTAPTPPQIVERGKLGTKLIVEALADKYLDHIPIERQSARYERAGVQVAPHTLGSSVASAIDLLAPIARAIREQTRGAGLLGMDTTGLPILDRAAPEGIRTGAITCWTNARWVSFVYSASADSQSVKDFLGDARERVVQCDGTSITSFIERAGGRRPGCWSHARRRFVEAARAGDRHAVEGLRLIAELFAIERASLDAGDNAEQRKQRRREHCAPVLDRLRAWLERQRAIIPPKTPLGQALGYAHRQWRRLILFLDDGNIELTNNRRERELRRLVLGRKNWLFTWGDVGGARTADILTIVATCIAHDVEPREYLHRVVQRILDGWPHPRLRELLPDRIAQSVPSSSPD